MEEFEAPGAPACDKCGSKLRVVARITGSWPVDVFVAITETYRKQWDSEKHPAMVRMVPGGYQMEGPVLCSCEAVTGEELAQRLEAMKEDHDGSDD